MLTQKYLHQWIVRIMSLMVMVSVLIVSSLAQTESITPLGPAKSQKQLKHTGPTQDIRLGQEGILLQEGPSKKTPNSSPKLPLTIGYKRESPPITTTITNITVKSKARDTLAPIADCTTTKTFEVTADKTVKEADYRYVDWEKLQKRIEKAAYDAARVGVLEGAGRIMADCKCTNSAC